MAQTGYSPILIYGSTTTGNTPAAGNLTTGTSGVELAINATDGKLFYKDNAGVVQTIATKAGAAGTFSNVTITGGSINGTTIGATTASTGAFTTLSASSTTTLSGGTANGVAYLNGSKVVTTGTALTFDGTNLGVGTSSPGYKLDVARGSSGIVAKFTGTASAYVYAGSQDVYFTSDTSANNAFGANSTSNYLNFYTNGSEQMRLTSTGLGIGTSSPFAKLAIEKTGGDALTARYNSSNGRAGIYIGGSSGVPFFGYNLTYSSGNVFNYDLTGMAWFAGDPSGSGVFGIKVGSGTSGTSFGTDTGAYTVYINTSGNLGLGVTPSAWGAGDTILQVKAGSSSGALWGRNSTLRMLSNVYYDGTNYRYIANGTATSFETNVSGGYNWNLAPSGTAGNAITFTQAMTLFASGNLCVGTTTDYYKITAYGATPDIVAVHNGANGTRGYITADNGAVYFGNTYSSSNVPLVFSQAGIGSAGVERARIDTSGNFLVGKTAVSLANNGFVAQANGYVSSSLSGTTNATDSYNLYSTGASAYRFYVDMAGTIHATSIVITAISDERLKENVRNIDTGLNDVLALKPRRFDWKEGKGQDRKNVAGFIAQEFEEVFPECIGTTKAGADGIEYKNINYETLIPTLVKAIQEQQALIQTLTDRITALEGK